jgi:hypothetical protein
MRLILISSLCCLVLACTDAYRGPFRRLYPKTKPSVVRIDDDPGEPLFLTPYLEQGKVDEARRLR